MILNGFRSLIRIVRGRPVIDTPPRGRSAGSLIAAAVTAAVFPAAAVTAGHLGSAILGKESHTTAALRAAVGFAATAGSALVLAPALTLLVLSFSESNRGVAQADRAGAVAMGVLWPVWTAGLVLGIPPLLGLGPEIGEIIWTVLALFIAVRVFNRSALPALEIRRRWASRFSTRVSIGFAILFISVAVVPAMAVRAALGAATVLPVSLPERDTLPRPPEPNW